MGVKIKGNALLTAVFAASLILLGPAAQTWGDEEISIDEATQPTPTPAASQNPSVAPAQAQPVAALAPTPVPSPTASSEDIQMDESSQAETQTSSETASEPTTTALTHGVLKMKDVYEAGVNAYKDQDYDRAIRYWKKAVEMTDPYTEKFYYAEAYAMLGVIYQFHIIHYGVAYRYYKEALRYEPHNETARRHIKQVYKYRNRKD